MIKRIFFILGLAALFPLSQTYAQTPPPDQSGGGQEWRKMTPEQRFDRFSEKLNLTEDQKPKVKAILDDWHAAMKEARTNAHNQLKAVLTPEQYQKFQSMKEEKMHHMHHMHEEGSMEGEENGNHENQ